MARTVLGIGTSHSPMPLLHPAKWKSFGDIDKNIPELVFPPDGWAMSWDEAVSSYISEEIRSKPLTMEIFTEQYEQARQAREKLTEAYVEAHPDVTIIITDDQDEWFFDHNMPVLAVYWDDTAPIVPYVLHRGNDPEVGRLVAEAYGDKPRVLPIASDFGRFLLEYLIDHNFDVAGVKGVQPEYGGSVARRYPTKGGGELQYVKRTEPRPYGLPHGVSYIVTSVFKNSHGPILPIFQNTCYPPTTITPSRGFDFGRAVGQAIEAWDSDTTVAVVASGGLSHFVVDEELDRTLLKALTEKDEKTLRGLPRHRLLSATSESMNWVTTAGVLHDTDLSFQLESYTPVYRSEAGTGGGWAYGCWRP